MDNGYLHLKNTFVYICDCVCDCDCDCVCVKPFYKIPLFPHHFFGSRPFALRFHFRIQDVQKLFDKKKQDIEELFDKKNQDVQELFDKKNVFFFQSIFIRAGHRT